MSDKRLSVRSARIVAALDQFAADLESGVPIVSRYTVRTVRVIPKPSPCPPAGVRANRELSGDGSGDGGMEVGGASSGEAGDGMSFL